MVEQYIRAMYLDLLKHHNPKSGWDYFEDFRQAEFSVDIIVGDHDFLDMGNGLIRKWTKDINQVDLVIIKHAGTCIMA